MMATVVIPTLNEEENIAKCLQSIRNQDYKNFEIIVADGGSTDKTVEIASKLADKVLFEAKRTIAAGRQKGADEAKGEVIVFADADAFYPPNWLSSLLRHFDDETVASAHGKIYLAEATFAEKFFHKSANLFFKASNALGHPTGAGANLAVRKTHFHQVLGFDTDLVTGEDVLLQKKLKKKGKIIFSDDSIAFVSARRVRKWGYAKFFLFHVKNWLLLARKKQPMREYEAVR